MPPTAAKRDEEQESQVLDWIEGNLGTKLNRDLEYPDMIKDGIALCDLMNILMPGCIKKIDRKGAGFALMQNIERFNKAIEKYGVPVRELFQTVDLWEKKNVPAVTLCLFALARETQRHPEYKGPVLGPKMSDPQDFNFTPEQLAAAKNTVSQQSGYNRGENQAGISMGKARGIAD